MDPVELRRLIEEAKATFAANEPAVGGEWLAAASPRSTTFVGTTLPVVASEFAARPSGILAPVASGPAPIDALVTYLTASEILGRAVPPSEILAAIRAQPPSQTLFWCGWFMRYLEKEGIASRSALLELADNLFELEARARARNFIESGRVLMAPQAILAVSKLALLLADPGQPAVPDGDARANTTLAILGLADHLGTADDTTEWGGFPQELALYVLRNQHFNAGHDNATVIGRYERLWTDLPVARDSEAFARHAALFEEQTGVTMDECSAVGLALWSGFHAQGPRLAPTYLSSITGIPVETVERALDLFVAGEETMTDLLRGELETQGFEWAFNVFRRFPVVRHQDRSITMLNLGFLRDRAFGAAAFWELHVAHKQRGKRRGPDSLGAYTGFRGDIVHDYVSEVLRSAYPGTHGARRVWTEEDFSSAWPAEGVQHCDSGVDFGDSWVLLEVVTHRVSEDAAAGGSVEAFERDMRMIIEEKAEQLHSTATNLLEQPDALLGPRARTPRRIHPVVVAAEGFPVNPITVNFIEERLASAGLLQDARIGQVEILHLNDLDVVEGLHEHAGAPDLAGLLAAKETAGMRLAAFDQFVAIERRLPLPRPARLTEASDRVFERVLKQLALPEPPA